MPFSVLISSELLVTVTVSSSWPISSVSGIETGWPGATRIALRHRGLETGQRRRDGVGAGPSAPSLVAPVGVGRDLLGRARRIVLDVTDTPGSTPRPCL